MGIWTTLSSFYASRLVDSPPWLSYKSSPRLHYHSPLPAYLCYSSSYYYRAAHSPRWILGRTLDKKGKMSCGCRSLLFSLFSRRFVGGKLVYGGNEVVWMGCKEPPGAPNIPESTMRRKGLMWWGDIVQLTTPHYDLLSAPFVPCGTKM